MPFAPFVASPPLPEVLDRAERNLVGQLGDELPHALATSTHQSTGKGGKGPGVKIWKNGQRIETKR